MATRDGEVPDGPQQGEHAVRLHRDPLRQRETVPMSPCAEPGDQTIRTFGYGWSGGYNMCKDIPNAVTAIVYQTGLDELRRTAMAAGPGFGTYYITGSSHTILRSSNYYTTNAGDTGVAQWIEKTLAGTATHVGP